MGDQSLHRLEPREVLSATIGDLNDGGGLLLRVSVAGASWVLRYTSPAGKRREMGLGTAFRDSQHSVQQAGGRRALKAVLSHIADLPGEGRE